MMYIHKTTAIWLFQEGERVSSDHLFRVRCKQPYSSSTPLAKCSAVSKDIDMQPIVSSTVQIGELCVFKKDNGWSIGRVLQFAKLQEKRISGQQFKGLKAEVSKSDLGVLCSWYTPMSGSSNFQLLKESCTTSVITHCYHPLKSYMCSLTSNCLIFVNKNEKAQESASIMSNIGDCSQVRMSTTEQFSLTERAKTFIDEIAKWQIASFNSLEQPSKKTNEKQDTIVISDSDGKAGHSDHGCWVKISGFYLFERDRIIPAG